MTSTSNASSSGRPLRADAARNRAAIVEAAAALMALHGTDVSLEAVARTAGIGSATLHRHFSSNAALVEAVLEDRVRVYAAAGESLAERARDHPGEAFSAFVDLLVKHLLEDRAFGQVIGSPSPVSDGFDADRTRSFVAFQRVVRRAKRAGVLRPDFDRSDLFLLVQAVNGLVAADRDTAAAASRRLAAYLVQAFCSSGTQLPPGPASWRSSIAAR